MLECASPRGTDVICSTAKNWCDQFIFRPFAGNWDHYYVPAMNPDPYPPPLEPYLQSSAVASKIGAYSTWLDPNYQVYFQFLATGDMGRSAKPYLEEIINYGVRTVIYDGDADFICNYISIEAMVREFLASLPSFSHCANPSADRLLKHEILGRVCEPELRDLYR